MTRPKTAYEKEAERLVTFAQYEFDLYKLQYPNRTSMVPTLEKSPYWHTYTDSMDGDFGLDDPVARKLLSQAVASSPELTNTINRYFKGDTFDAQGNLNDNILDTLLGRGNIAGNINTFKQAGEAFLTQAKIDKILAGAVKNMQINSNMKIYMKNKQLRVKISNMKIDVIQSMFEKGIKTTANSSGVWANANQVGAKGLNKLAAASNLKFWTSFRGGGVLAFGPTLALDLYYNTSRDANGLHFDANKFGRDQLKNQSGNAVGFAAGVIVGIFFGASAPVIIAGFIAGFALQMVWNAYGMPDKMEKLPDNLDKIQQWQKKNIGPTEEEIRMYTQE